MKQTDLHETHKALGAKMVPFAGYEMPVQYDGVNLEHLAVRNSIGVFDVSHMGEFLIEGPNALDLVQSVCSNDAARLAIGQAQYSCFPNSNGGIVDDLIVYRLDEAAYLMVVNASNIEKDWNWIQSKNLENVKMKNLSDDYSLLAIQGPVAVQAMQPLSNLDLSAIKFYHFKVGDFAGIDGVIISATGYTGSG
jgi:aminomethyltransferase